MVSACWLTRSRSPRFTFTNSVMLWLLVISGGTLAAGEEAVREESPRYLDANQPVEARLDDLLPRLTLEEKVQLLVADPSAGTSLDTALNERLRIPRFSMTDGPHGASFAKHFGQGATAFPTGITLASSWDVDLLRQVGQAIARETRAEGRNVILGPCVNIHRTPFGGRNFESFSEDPYLAAKLAVAYIQGVQSERTVACVKHFACNNQEWYRMTTDTVVSERALREIYLPAFRAAVQEGGAHFVMAAYNRLNGQYACENEKLLTDILKDKWGFKGAVISDWGAVHSTLPTAQAGLDLEMGGTSFLGEPLLAAVRKGEVSESLVDDKVRRLLRVLMVTGIFDESWRPRKTAEELYRRPAEPGEFDRSMYDLPARFDNDPLDGPAHRSLALRAAREGMVLLKNDQQLLPLDRSEIRSIAVIGPNAAWGNRGGGGSSEVTPSYISTPLEAILNKASDSVEVRYELGSTFDRRYYIPHVRPHRLSPPDSVDGDQGLQGEYFDNPDLAGQPVLTRRDDQVFFHWGANPPGEGVPAHGWSARWTGKIRAPQSGPYRLYLFHHGAFYANEQGDGARLFVNGQLVIDDWKPERCRVPSAIVTLDSSQPAEIRLEYHDAGPGKQAIMILGWLPLLDDPIARAAKCARQCDVAILCLGDNQYYGGENNDRGDLRLPGDQEALIAAVTAANPRTIVALYNGSPLLMEEWIDQPAAIIECWYPNQEGGAALADILFGDINPSGKLPVTFGRRREDYPDAGNYPGDGQAVVYAEGIYVGYRHFDRQQIAPRFPFGFGLSYTTFAYDDLQITPLDQEGDTVASVTCRVKNRGDRFGKEIVQLYLHDPESSLDRPEQELKGFKKVGLAVGESATVTFSIDRDDLSFFDPATSAWKIEPGAWEVRLGSSSRDVRLRGELRYDGTTVR